jgi:valyl-tRNA synthetase
VLANRPDPLSADHAPPTLATRWISSRLDEAVTRATAQLDAIDLGGYAATVYDVAWSDYCDWFLEMAKVDLRREDATDADRAATWRAAAEGLAVLLRLLHPLMPFVTEAVWETLHAADADATAGEPLLIRAAWPVAGSADPASVAAFDELAGVVRAARNLRTEAEAPAAAWIPLVVEPGDAGADERLEALRPYVESLARVRPISIADGEARPAHVAATGLGAVWLGVDEAEAGRAEARRQARLDEIDRGIARLRELLGNAAFADRAPADVVQRERDRLAALEEERRQLASG